MSSVLMERLLNADSMQRSQKRFLAQTRFDLVSLYSPEGPHIRVDAGVHSVDRK